MGKISIGLGARSGVDLAALRCELPLRDGFLRNIGLSSVPRLPTLASTYVGTRPRSNTK